MDVLHPLQYLCTIRNFHTYFIRHSESEIIGTTKREINLCRDLIPTSGIENVHLTVDW